MRRPASRGLPPLQRRATVSQGARRRPLELPARPRAARFGTAQRGRRTMPRRIGQLPQQPATPDRVALRQCLDTGMKGLGRQPVRQDHLVPGQKEVVVGHAQPRHDAKDATAHRRVTGGDQTSSLPNSVRQSDRAEARGAAARPPGPRRDTLPPAQRRGCGSGEVRCSRRRARPRWVAPVQSTPAGRLECQHLSPGPRLSTCAGRRAWQAGAGRKADHALRALPRAPGASAISAIHEIGPPRRQPFGKATRGRGASRSRTRATRPVAASVGDEETALERGISSVRPARRRAAPGKRQARRPARWLKIIAAPRGRSRTSTPCGPSSQTGRPLQLKPHRGRGRERRAGAPVDPGLRPCDRVRARRTWVMSATCSMSFSCIGRLARTGGAGQQGSGRMFERPFFPDFAATSPCHRSAPGLGIGGPAFRRFRRLRGRASRPPARPRPPAAPRRCWCRCCRPPRSAGGRWRRPACAGRQSLVPSGPSTAIGPSAPIRSRQVAVIIERYSETTARPRAGGDVVRWCSASWRCGRGTGRSRPRSRAAAWRGASMTDAKVGLGRDRAGRRRAASYSRPPMKRADGTGSPKALTLISVSRAGSSARLRAADRHRDHPGAGGDDRERRRRVEEMGIERGVGIVDAARDGRSGGQAGRGGDLGQDRAEEVAGLARPGPCGPRVPSRPTERGEAVPRAAPRGRCGSRAR